MSKTDSKTKVNTPEFRVAFPSVFQARRNDLSGKDEYSVVALFPPGADLSKLKAAALVALHQEFGPDKAKWPKKLKTPFKDQGDREKLDEETGKMVLPQGYVKGAIYINLKSTQKPGVVDSAVEEIIDTSDFYGGCWARASVNAFGYNKKGNRGVSFGLINLQKIRDGDAFGNRTKATDDFSAVSTPAGENSQSSADLFS